MKWAIGGLIAFVILIVATHNPKKTQDQYACTNLDKAKVGWRADCRMATSMAWAPFKSPDLPQKWCECVLEKFDFRALLNSRCDYVNRDQAVALSHRDDVKATCGTPADPL
jgi:hypothetical protein